MKRSQFSMSPGVNLIETEILSNRVFKNKEKYSI